MFDVHRTTAPAYTVEVDGDTFRYAEANQALVERALFITRFHSGLTPSDCFPAAVADAIEARYRTCCRTRDARTYDSASIFPNDTRRWRTTLIPVVGDTGAVTKIVAIVMDVVEQVPKEIDPDDNKSSQAIGAIDGGFWVFETATGTFETSRSLAELLAGPGRKTLDLAEYAGHIHADDMKTAALLSPPADRSSVEFRVITHDGRMLWLQSNRKTVRDTDGTAVRVVGLVLDITERKTAMRTLESEASTDSLTGLMNRRAFLKIARRKLRTRGVRPGGLDLILIDIDGFKAVNDRNGHLAGDDLLRQVARRLTRAIRKPDTLARMGGDEFAVLSTGDDAGQIIEQRIQRAFAKPFRVGDTTTLIGVSVGSCRKAENDKTVELLFARADRALYARKTARRLLSA